MHTITIRQRTFVFALCGLCFVAVGCSSDDDGYPSDSSGEDGGALVQDGTDGGDATATDGTGDEDAAPVDSGGTEDGAGGDGGVIIPEGFPKAACDAIDPTFCALPWPSDLYLAEDSATVTGKRLVFGETSLPATTGGVHIDPALFAGLDGYGLGTPILFDLGALDFSQLPDEWDTLLDSEKADSPSLLFEVTDDGLVQRPHFVEPDRTGVDDDTLTILRPAVILEPNTRYIVALRGLKRPDGSDVPASEAFAALRDDTPTDDPGVEARRAAFEAMFTELEGAGVSRGSLVLAWSFHTASLPALHDPLDQATAAAVAAMPDGGTLAVGEVQEVTKTKGETDMDEDPWIGRRVIGTFTAPAVVDPPQVGGAFRRVTNDDGQVIAKGSFDTPIQLMVPHRALADGQTPGEPVGVIVYGHGLLGDEWEVRAGHLRRIAEELGYIIAGVPMVGMSESDYPEVTVATSNLNAFPVISDGLLQGLVQHHLLVRAAKSGALEAALQAAIPGLQIDEAKVHFFGGSQGGIFGGTLLATSPDLTRALLGVPGNNYATMLSRSVNFDPFFALLRLNYGSDVGVTLGMAAAQLLWDRTDPVSFRGRMARGDNAVASHPADKRALLLLSKGDKQVAVVTEEIAARTYPELAVMAPWDDARSIPGVTETPYPHEGSAMILFDFGNPWPKTEGNLPPDNELSDPHSRISEVDAAGTLVEAFYDAGKVIDVCGGDGCSPD